jgi:hypothetical protein
MSLSSFYFISTAHHAGVAGTTKDDGRGSPTT